MIILKTKLDTEGNLIIKTTKHIYKRKSEYWWWELDKRSTMSDPYWIELDGSYMENKYKKSIKKLNIQTKIVEILTNNLKEFSVNKDDLNKISNELYDYVKDILK